MTAQAGSASSPSFSPAADRPAARRALRRQMRALRTTLTRKERHLATIAFAREVQRARLMRPGMKIAAYLAVRHEADVSALVAKALELGCEVYLPRITNLRSGRMEFLRFQGLRKLRRNAVGLLEPAPTARRIPPRELDRAFVPLAAFDARGNRLGTGGGFYDRRFAYLGRRRSWRKPRLIGVGYELQRVPAVAAEPWDVVLDAVVTERGVHRQHC